MKKAQQAAAGQKTIAHLPAKTRTTLGKQGARPWLSVSATVVAQHKRNGGGSPKIRVKPYRIARKGDLPRRSK